MTKHVGWYFSINIISKMSNKLHREFVRIYIALYILLMLGLNVSWICFNEIHHLTFSTVRSLKYLESCITLRVKPCQF